MRGVMFLPRYYTAPATGGIMEIFEELKERGTYISGMNEQLESCENTTTILGDGKTDVCGFDFLLIHLSSSI